MLTQAVSTEPKSALDARSVHVDSYYAASANRSTLRPQLHGEVAVDACVVGGECYGLRSLRNSCPRGQTVRREQISVPSKLLGLASQRPSLRAAPAQCQC
jgi:hypothetical protein